MKLSLRQISIVKPELVKKCCLILDEMNSEETKSWHVVNADPGYVKYIGGNVFAQRNLCFLRDTYKKTDILSLDDVFMDSEYRPAGLELLS